MVKTAAAKPPLPRFTLCAATLAIAMLSLSVGAAPWPLVINNGRVIDPETGLDAIRHLAIQKGEIVALSEEPLDGQRMIDATGYVVAPGFIDIHSHTPTPMGMRLNVLDGVTTQLDTEAGAYPVSAYGSAIQQAPLVNYGASVGHFATRIKVIEGKDQPYFFHGDSFITMGTDAWEKPATADQLAQIQRLLVDGLESGGIGIGVLLDYMRDAVNSDELRMIFETAAQFDAPVFIHVRRNMPGDAAGLDEALGLAIETGAPVFICHITHNAMGGIGDWLAKIDAAREQGAQVATETLSYLAGGTSISADVFRKRDWQSIFDITYEDVQWTATGEWLTQETWDYYAKNHPDGAVNHHYVKESWLRTALEWPDMMVSTDAMPAFVPEQLSNPNIAGTFSLLLGEYVRDKQYLSLSDALSRISLKPAQWLQGIAPVFADKGRIQLGKDADIVIFDPATISANATYGDPYASPTGMEWVIVNGEVVVDQGRVVVDRFPGERMLGVGR